MMAQAKETAEQKLLKMIEASSKPGEPSSTKSEKRASKKISTIALLKISNKFLTVGIIIALGLFLNEVKVGAELSKKDFSVPESGEAKELSKESANSLPAVADVSIYLAAIKGRNIFVPFEQAEAKPVVDVSTLNRHVAEKTKLYKLVGISWLDNVDSASVMLEDTGKGTTYFLQKGEKIGDIFVKTIYADSVKLGYENEEIIIGYDKTQK
ncbi:MAG: hypothetical protein HQL24_01470 [Candidatus Omnitrophica bacterium]|nr:hypothetical protein [Candidatus Omnitrophota bacterium]